MYHHDLSHERPPIPQVTGLVSTKSHPGEAPQEHHDAGLLVRTPEWLDLCQADGVRRVFQTGCYGWSCCRPLI